MRAFAVLLGVVLAAPALASHKSDFQDGTTQGWDGAAGMLVNQADGGPEGAGDRYLEITADGSGPGGKVASFNLSADWTGNYQSVGVFAIRMDVKVFSGTALEMRIVLFGPSGTPWSSATSVPVAADGQWHEVVLPFGDGDLVQVGVGSDTYRATISSVSRILIRHQAGAPAFGGTDYVGVAGLDNIFAPTVFVNGFESGDTSLWSAAVGLP